MRKMTWEIFERDFKTLYGSIALSTFKPEVIIAVTKGGNVIATKLSYLLDIPLHYYDPKSKIWSRGAFPLFLQMKNILIIDDINDSGKTISQIRADIDQLLYPKHTGQLTLPFSADNIKYGVLVDNITSKSRVDFCGNFIDRDEDKEYINFPWEIFMDE